MLTQALSPVHLSAMELAAARYHSLHLLPCTSAGWQLTWEHLGACAQCENEACLCSDICRLELASGGPGLPGDPLCLVLQFWQVLQDRRLPDHQQRHGWVLLFPLLLSF